MAEKEKLEVELLATDRASNVVDRVAAKVEAVDGERAEVEISAEDEATDHVARIMARIEAETDKDKVVILKAEAKRLESTVRQSTLLLGRLDGKEAEATIDVRNRAKAKLDGIQAELRNVDNTEVEARVDALTPANTKIDGVQAELREVDNTEVDARIDAQVGAGLEGLFDKLDGIPGNVSGIGGNVLGLAKKGGPVALLAAAFGASAMEASNVALEVDQIAKFTGSSHEEASRLYAVWRDNQLEANDLLDIVAQMQGVLEDNPELARELGLSMDLVRTDPLAAMIAAVDLLNSDQLTANEKIVLGSKLFGEEGVRQINLLTAAVGPDGLQAAIDGVSESRLVSERDVEAAREFQQKWREALDKLKGFGMTLGGPVLDALNTALTVAEQIGGAFGWLDEAIGDKFGGDWTMLEQLEERVVAVNDALNTGVGLEEAFFEAMANAGTPATGEQFEAYLGLVERVRQAVADGKPIVEAWNDVFGAGGEIVAENADKWGIFPPVIEDVTDATEDAKTAAEEHAEALQEEADALRDTVDASKEKVDALLELADADDEVAEAEREMTSAAEDANAAMTDSEASAKDQADALLKVKRAADDVAGAEVNRARLTAQARGETLSETAALDIMTGSYARQAAMVTGPARQAILQRIDDLHDIPDDVMTKIETAIADGDIEEAERLINNASRTRTTVIRYDDDRNKLDEIERQLNHTTRDRSAKVYYTPSGAGYTAAHGTPYSNEGIYRVGEQGEETVYLPRGSKVVPNHRQNLESQPSGASTTSITNNYWPQGVDSRSVLRAQRDYRDRNGR